MSKQLQKLLFKIARSNISGYFIGTTFAHASSLIPVNKVISNSELLVFQHPVPHWDIHYLIVPKKRLPTLLSLLDLANAESLLQAIAQAAQDVSTMKNFEEYTILVNWGRYQDVPQLHFHVASGKDLGSEKLSPTFEEWHQATHWDILKNEETSHKLHMTLSLKQNHNLAESLQDLVVCTQHIAITCQLNAFTLLTNIKAKETHNLKQFHLISN